VDGAERLLALEPSLDALQAQLSASVKPPHGLASMRLTKSVPVEPQLAARLARRFETCQRQLFEPSLVLDLYLAAPRPLLQRVLAQGFAALESVHMYTAVLAVPVIGLRAAAGARMRRCHSLTHTRSITNVNVTEHHCPLFFSRPT